MKPEINLLYYKNILDLVMIRFFSEFNEYFTKSNNIYVFSNNLSKSKLKKIFKNLFFDELKKYITPYSILQPRYYFIIGSCFPKNNILLNFKNETFPEKLNNILLNQPNVKYILKENDIDIDITLINDIFISIFNDLFTKKNYIEKYILGNFKNIMFITHKNFDCYMMFKIIKWMFGNNNCINIWKIKNLDKIKSPLIAINDLISKFIKCKNKLNSNDEFKKQCNIVKKFIFEKINEINSME